MQTRLARLTLTANQAYEYYANAHGEVSIWTLC